jgi:UDP-N-acetylglucosamine 2-epimerase (non-hydrolysing)
LAGFSKKGYAVATLHRAENTNRGDILLAWMNAFERISETLPILFPLHPRTRKQLDSMSYEPRSLRLRLIEPQGYLNMMALMMHARAVLSDSGGIQAETTALGVPCFTLRDSTNGR